MKGKDMIKTIVTDNFQCNIDNFNMSDELFMSQFEFAKEITDFFKQSGDRAVSNDYFAYFLSSVCVNEFKNLIVKNDVDCVYHREQDVEIVNSREVNKIINNELPKDIIDSTKNFDEAVSKFREEHPEFFETLYVLPSIGRKFSDFNVNLSDSTIEDIVDGYKFANLTCNSISADSISDYRTTPRVSLKKDPDIKKAYNDEIAKLEAYYGLDKLDALEEQIASDYFGRDNNGDINYPKVKTNKTRICLNRNKPSNNSCALSATDQFVNFLLGRVLY